MIYLSNLIIIRGNSGSDKTTLAKEIHKECHEIPYSFHKIPLDGRCFALKMGKNSGTPLFIDLTQYDYVILKGILNAE